MSDNREQAASRDLGSSLGSSTAAAIDQMIRWPFWFTGATMDLMMQGVERRLPKEEPDVTRIERVTIERGTDTRTSVA